MRCLPFLLPLPFRSGPSLLFAFGAPSASAALAKRVSLRSRSLTFSISSCTLGFLALPQGGKACPSHIVVGGGLVEGAGLAPLALAMSFTILLTCTVCSG